MQTVLFTAVLSAAALVGLSGVGLPQELTDQEVRPQTSCIRQVSQA